jgi:hypothetical protein
METMDPHAAGMIVREVDGALLILDTASNHIHQLNETASIVWRMRREGAAPRDIAAILADEFAVEEDQALADVHDLLQRLESLHLLTPSPSGTGCVGESRKEI